ncbi:MAG: 16S rRNA (guanine(527)-N(7))-methyltransferase RsmG [Pseudomonadota bacterium]
MSDPLLPGLDVSRETRERLEAFQALLLKWNRRINLISRATAEDAWTRHILDSAQLWPLAESAPSWADFGAGAGLPGLVIAILAAELDPAREIHLIESDQRKVAFQREAARTLGLSPILHTTRIEELPPRPFGILSARALAPLPRLLPQLAPFTGPGSQILLPKGAALDKELTAAEADWHIEADRVASLTDPAGQILRIHRLEPRP